MRYLIISLIASSTLLANTTFEAGDSVDAVEEENKSSGWSFRVSAGPTWRHLGTLRTYSGSRSQGMSLQSLVGSSSLTMPSIGDTSSTADRTYNDGYVNKSPLTDTTGLTWYWGYENNSQVQGDSLFYSATGWRSDYSEGYDGGNLPVYESNVENFGFSLDCIVTPPVELKVPFRDILLSLTYFHADKDRKYSSYTGMQGRNDYRLDIVDRYDLDGVIPPLAPYSGTYAGPGPSIENIPDSRNVTDVLVNSETANIQNTIRAKIEMDVISLALAPTFDGSFNEKLHWYFSVGPTLNLFSFDGSQHETLEASVSSGNNVQLSEWYETNSTTKFRVGAMGKASMSRQFKKGWSVDVSFRVEWVDDVAFEVGPTTYRLDPLGYSLGLGVSRSF